MRGAWVRGICALAGGVAAVTLGAASASSAGVERIAFRGTIVPISPAMAKRMTGVSWHRGCPVSLRDLRVVTLTVVRFDGTVGTGRQVVNRDVAPSVVSVFRRLYRDRVPIRMVPVDAHSWIIANADVESSPVHPIGAKLSLPLRPRSIWVSCLMLGCWSPGRLSPIQDVRRRG